MVVAAAATTGSSSLSSTVKLFFVSWFYGVCASADVARAVAVYPVKFYVLFPVSELSKIIARLVFIDGVSCRPALCGSPKLSDATLVKFILVLRYVRFFPMAGEAADCFLVEVGVASCDSYLVAGVVMPTSYDCLVVVATRGLRHFFIGRANSLSQSSISGMNGMIRLGFCSS